MAQSCAICGKTISFGNLVERRGLPKKKGGVGLKVTGISRRKFRPNLQRVKVKRNGTVRRLRICTRCIKSGRVEKAG
jgi:large subunit ribosomal protein L28